MNCISLQRIPDFELAMLFAQFISRWMSYIKHDGDYQTELILLYFSLIHCDIHIRQVMIEVYICSSYT